MLIKYQYASTYRRVTTLLVCLWEWQKQFHIFFEADTRQRLMQYINYQISILQLRRILLKPASPHIRVHKRFVCRSGIRRTLLLSMLICDMDIKNEKRIWRIIAGRYILCVVTIMYKHLFDFYMEHIVSFKHEYFCHETPYIEVPTWITCYVFTKPYESWHISRFYPGFMQN